MSSSEQGSRQHLLEDGKLSILILTSVGNDHEVSLLLTEGGTHARFWQGLSNLGKQAILISNFAFNYFNNRSLLAVHTSPLETFELRPPPPKKYHYGVGSNHISLCQNHTQCHFYNPNSRQTLTEIHQLLLWWFIHNFQCWNKQAVSYKTVISLTQCIFCWIMCDINFNFTEHIVMQHMGRRVTLHLWAFLGIDENIQN